MRKLIIPIVLLLGAHGAFSAGMTNTVEAAVGRGLARVRQAATFWQGNKTCFSCHHHTLPMLAMTEAARAGFPVDAAWLQSQAETTREYFEERIEDMDEGDHVPGGAATAGYGLWALQLAGHARDATTSATVNYLLHIQGVQRLKPVKASESAQPRDGSWIASCRRPPMQASKFADTTLVLMGLKHFATVEQRPRVVEARARAGQWLAQTPLRDQQDRLWRLWGLHHLGGGDAEKQVVRAELLAAQNPDGGWPEGRERAASDTYTTGQALFMLAKTGLARDHAALVRARDYLLARQHADGSWLAESHVVNKAQPYFENGDPFGEHQFLSVAATAWATAGLAQLLPAATPAAADGLQLAAVLRDEAALTGAHDIEVVDGLAYVAGKGFTRRNLPRDGVFPYEAGRGGALAVVDVMRPDAPMILWHSRTPLAYEDAETVLPLGGGRLLVGTRDVFLFDVASPTQARELAAIRDRTQVDLINGFAWFGDAVFGANKLGHVFAVDVSMPDTIRLIGTRETKSSGELTSPHDAAFCGDLLVVVSPEGFGGGSRPGRLGVYRVVDSATGRPLPVERWTLVGRLEHPRLAGANRVMARGRFAFVGSSLSENFNRADGLRGNVAVVDLNDPTRPRLRGSVDFPDNRGPNGLEVAGTMVFAAGGKTVTAVDVSDADAPVEVARFQSDEAFPGGADDAHDLVFADGHLFVTAQTSHSLVVLKVNDRRILDGTRR